MGSGIWGFILLSPLLSGPMKASQLRATPRRVCKPALCRQCATTQEACGTNPCIMPYKARLLSMGICNTPLHQQSLLRARPRNALAGLKLPARRGTLTILSSTQTTRSQAIDNLPPDRRSEAGLAQLLRHDRSQVRAQGRELGVQDRVEKLRHGLYILLHL